MSDFDDFLKEKLKDPEFKVEYDALKTEFSLIQQNISSGRKETLKAMAEVEYMRTHPEIGKTNDTFSELLNDLDNKEII